eukprot:237924-Karenia_brevis.AAC.1
MIIKGNLPVKNVNLTLNQAGTKFAGAPMFKQTGFVYNGAAAFCITLADALEMYVADQLSKAMDAGKMVGFSFVSDESPPKSAKYSGLRFQITWVYIVIFADTHEWDSPAYENELPLYRRNSGRATNCCCSSGVGDGGGENEGCNGVHALLERRDATYIRRRCLLHLPWRVADQGLLEMTDVFEDTKAISAYLHDGSTWARFKALATQPTAAGGLG